VISLVAVPVWQVGEAVPQADDGVETALGHHGTQVSHQAHPVRFLYHPAGNEITYFWTDLRTFCVLSFF
jgi:hypothetical protein